MIVNNKNKLKVLTSWVRFSAGKKQRWSINIAELCSFLSTEDLALYAKCDYTYAQAQSYTQQTTCSSTQYPSTPQCHLKWEHSSAPEGVEISF